LYQPSHFLTRLTTAETTTATATATTASAIEALQINGRSSVSFLCTRMLKGIKGWQKK